MKNDPINGRTPENLKDALMRCGRRHCKAESGDCPYYIDCLVGATRLKLMKDAFDYIRHLESERDAALDKQPKWISVEERLPDKLVENNSVYLSEEVIGFDGECAYIGQFKAYKFDGHFVFFDGDGFREDVTHWMPLPEPPKKEDTDE